MRRLKCFTQKLFPYTSPTRLKDGGRFTRAVIYENHFFSEKRNKIQCRSIHSFGPMKSPIYYRIQQRGKMSSPCCRGVQAYTQHISSRTLTALHCTSLLAAYLPMGVIDLKIRWKSVYVSVCYFIKGALQKQPSESREVENTVVTLSAYFCVCLCSFLHKVFVMQCFACQVSDLFTAQQK